MDGGRNLKFNKAHIIAEIQRTAAENGGSPLGIERFQAETGIARGDWLGKFWARWGDALKEAGFDPNQLQGPRSDDDLLESLAKLTKELGRFPVDSEIKLKVKNNPGFPSHSTFARFGSRTSVAARLLEFAESRGYEDVVTSCKSYVASRRPKEDDGGEEVATDERGEIGFVYLLKSGRNYKIGRSNSPGRRERELAIQLPDEANLVHSIKTDDPVGIERYWHNRFADRRKNGEWFELSAPDVAAFRRRKFM